MPKRELEIYLDQLEAALEWIPAGWDEHRSRLEQMIREVRTELAEPED